MASSEEPRDHSAGPEVDPVEWVAIASLALALAIGAFVSLRAGWTPISDDALIELRVRDVPGELPLVGVYSRYGWSHPGPLQLWLLAVPYRLMGAASAALLVGAMIGHFVAILSAWWLARRMDVLAGAMVLVAMATTLVTTPAELVRTPWNPYVALVGAATVVVAGWATAQRRAAGPVALVVFGSLLVQAHAVTAPYVATAALTAIVLAMWAPRDAELPALRWRGFALAAGVGVILWLAPVVDQLTGDPGNISRFLDQLGGDEPRAGLSSALGVFTQSFAPVPRWFDRGSATDAFLDPSLAVPVWLVIPAAGLVVAIARRSWCYVTGSLIAGAALFGTFVATAVLTGGLFSYLVVGNRSIAIVSIAIGVASLLSTRTERVQLQAVRVGAALVVVLSVALAAQQVTGENPNTAYGTSVRALTGQVRDQLPEREPVAVTSVVDFRSSEIASALLLQLERAGYDVYGLDMDSIRIGAHRVAEPGTAVELIVAPIEAGPRLEGEGWQVIARYDPLDDAIRRRVSELVDERDRVIGGIESLDSDEQRRSAQIRVLELNAEITESERGEAPMLVARRDPSEPSGDSDRGE